MNARRSALALIAALAACRERYHPALDASRAAPVDSASVAVDASEPLDARSVEPVIVAVIGGASLDTSLRCDPSGARADAGGTRSAAVVGRVLHPCEQAISGADSGLTAVLVGGGLLSVGADAVVEAAGYAGAALTLSRGVACVTVPMLAREPARVDTPAGRLIVASGTSLVAVADDGSVRVSVDDGAATLWPSPPAPPRRATALTEAERRRLALASPGRPILLDVELPELAATRLPPATSRSLGAGQSLAFSSSGAALSGALTRASGDVLTGDVERWRRLRDERFRRPDAHLVAIEELSRAGAGDVAELRVALARLRTRRDLSTRDRDELAARLSLSLGRLTARARRGRELAARGGNVTALVQMAPMEELRAEALRYAPLR